MPPPLRPRRRDKSAGSGGGDAPVSPRDDRPDADVGQPVGRASGRRFGPLTVGVGLGLVAVAGWVGYTYMQLPAEIDVLGRPALAPTFELPADVGVGVPLDTSSADIDVLVADEAVALEAAPAASANIALLSPTEVHTYPVEVVAPPVDVSPLKFGVVLNLLVSSLSAERGDVAGTVATLVTLAARMNQPLLQAAVGDLAALVGDGRIDSRARLMAVWDAVARVNVPAIARDEAPAWLGGLVTVRRVGEVSSSLPMAVVRDVREAMMEGDMVRVASLLEAAPLGGDARLDDLRARVARVVAVDHALARVTATYQALLTEGQL